MERLFNIDWHDLHVMFVPTESIFEIIIRGTIMYLAMYSLLRIFRRQSGTVGVADVLVIVVIADAGQNGMAGDSKSITEALILIMTIVLWDFFFDWLGFKSTFAARFLTPNPLLLIEDGKFIKKNLNKEFLTEDEVYSQLREQGLEDATNIKQCYIESNGHFSILLQSPDKRKKGN